MSEQYEPSYYEIALTGRQVLVAFVILLVCLVAAFFSGVWVGRGGPSRTGQAAAVQAAARAEVPSDSEAAGTGESVPEQEGVEALSFFDQEAQKGSAGSAGSGGGKAAAAAEQPPAPGPKAGSAERPAPSGGEAVETPEPTRPAEEENGTGGSAAAAAGPGGGPQAPKEGAQGAPEHPRETVNPSGALSGGDVVIQVFSSSDKAKAQEILDRLKANDFRAFISPVTDDGRTLYRVRVGPFEHQDDAERVAAELRRRLDLDTWITR